MRKKDNMVQEDHKVSDSFIRNQWDQINELGMQALFIADKISQEFSENLQLKQKLYQYNDIDQEEEILEKKQQYSVQKLEYLKEKLQNYLEFFNTELKNTEKYLENEKNWSLAIQEQNILNNIKNKMGKYLIIAESVMEFINYFYNSMDGQNLVYMFQFAQILYHMFKVVFYEIKDKKEINQDFNNKFILQLKDYIENQMINQDKLFQTFILDLFRFLHEGQVQQEQQQNQTNENQEHKEKDSKSNLFFQNFNLQYYKINSAQNQRESSQLELILKLEEQIRNIQTQKLINGLENKNENKERYNENKYKTENLININNLNIKQEQPQIIIKSLQDLDDYDDLAGNFIQQIALLNEKIQQISQFLKENISLINSKQEKRSFREIWCHFNLITILQILSSLYQNEQMLDFDNIKKYQKIQNRSLDQINEIIEQNKLAFNYKDNGEQIEINEQKQINLNNQFSFMYFLSKISENQEQQEKTNQYFRQNSQSLLDEIINFKNFSKQITQRQIQEIQELEEEDQLKAESVDQFSQSKLKSQLGSFYEKSPTHSEKQPQLQVHTEKNKSIASMGRQNNPNNVNNSTLNVNNSFSQFRYKNQPLQLNEVKQFNSQETQTDDDNLIDFIPRPVKEELAMIKRQNEEKQNQIMFLKNREQQFSEVFQKKLIEEQNLKALLLDERSKTQKNQELQHDQKEFYKTLYFQIEQKDHIISKSRAKISDMQTKIQYLEQKIQNLRENLQYNQKQIEYQKDLSLNKQLTNDRILKQLADEELKNQQLEDKIKEYQQYVKYNENADKYYKIIQQLNA
ncbi:hypothetical protein PPERSA_08173 [Pseudocohnilembus persalinus]|uniref:Uncharacterized protein n=1 Tax=Pseudocohnilembus persalinus TaxID=266149 RepID=A0A0V0R3L7_PSEPJ|nr:hypothetical protein PPERSA_08173 [Pseudocohnilembus persalinus]|eukprot:KRX08970.1 hypothetical protein PPERSA_08173 [Pseudocohnilembus persalinus]